MLGIHGGDIYRNRVKMDFSVNCNPLGRPSEVDKALHRAVRLCCKYPDIAAEKLKMAVGSAFGIREECLVFGNGASELFLGIMHVVRPKKTVIVSPSFYGYEYVAKAVESEIIYFPLKKEREFLPGEDLLEVLSEVEEGDIFFFANPNNPTGRQSERGYLRELIEKCKEKGIWMVLDECFIEFCERDESMLSEIENYGNLLLVRAFTKIYEIPGVRLGYLVCSNFGFLEKIKRQLPEWNISTFAQEAGIVCAGQSEFVAKTVDFIKEERGFLSDGLKRLGLHVFSSEANFLLVFSEKPLYQWLLKQGILIRDCRNFRGLSEGYYRIAVRTREENRMLLKAIGEWIV